MLDVAFPKIVGVLTPGAIEQDILCATAHPPDVIEYRADLGDRCDTAVITAHLARIVEALPQPVIFTLRDAREGGGFSGDDALRMALYRAALPLVDAVDIECCNAQALAALREEFKAAFVSAILSYHNFEETPADPVLDAVIEQAGSAGADIIKIAALCRTREDLVRLLALPLRYDARTLAVVGMGPYGRAVRAVAPVVGSVLGYASLSNEVAPGQMSVADLRHVWQIVA